MKYLISFFLFHWMLIPLSAQWESMNGPYGGSINDLAQNDHYQFTATPNGIFRSSDEGQTWHHLKLEFGKSYACLQIGIYGHIILTDAVNYTGAKVNRYLFRSEDDGETWQQINRPAADSYLSIAINDAHIYLTDQRDLWVSLDEGTTWNLSQINPALGFIQNLKCFNDHIYVNTSSKLFKSNGLNDDFDEIQFGDFGYAYSFLASDSLYLILGENDKLYRSNDGGITWSNPLSELDRWGSITKNDKAIFVNTTTSVFKSVDNGLTWTDQRTQSFAKFVDHLMATENNLLSGALYTGIQSSSNEGKTFSESNLGLFACNTLSMAVQDNKLFVGTAYKGISGYNLQTEEWDATYSFNAFSEAIDISNFSGNLLATTGIEIYKSFDRGENWNNVYDVSTHPRPSTFFPFNNSILAGGSPGNSLLISSDNGDSWTDFKIKVNGANVGSTYLFASNAQSMFVAKRKVLFRSDDHGATWDTSMFGLILDENYSFIEKLYAFGNTIIMLEYDEPQYNYKINISYNNGHSWQSYSEGLPDKEYFRGIQSITKVGGVLLGCMYNEIDGVYVSFNNGMSWQSFNDGLLLGGVYEIIHDDTYLYAATSGQGVWRRKISDLNTVSTNHSPTPPEISIYPNPTNGNIWLEMESWPSMEVSIIISTVQGQVMVSEKIFLNSRTEINTDQLPSGTYILTVKNRDQVISNKFMITK